MAFKQDTAETRVIYRTFKGKDRQDVIALFPDIEEGHGLIGSYQHVGQHGGASPRLIDDTRPSTPEEIEPLRRELESAPYGYKLKPIKRMPRR